MTFNDTETSVKRYTLRPTFTPLPQAKEGNAASERATASEGSNNNPHKQTEDETGQTKKQPKADSIIRAANEDDDLYDPYSDYHDGTLKPTEFEEDPWR